MSAGYESPGAMPSPAVRLSPRNTTRGVSAPDAFGAENDPDGECWTIGSGSLLAHPDATATVTQNSVSASAADRSSRCASAALGLPVCDPPDTAVVNGASCSSLDFIIL